MQIHNKPIHHFIKEHLLLVILICLATFLRTYQLGTHGIFFFDAGHDLLAAHQAVTTGTVPLVGITSSRPWLHQGPIAIWFEMLVMLAFGTSTLAQHVFFAVLGIAAIIALYELVTIHLDRKMAYYAVALLTVFPLAVASSRMPYHTTPIPLATVLYLWALVGLWKKYSLKQVLLVGLAAILLFQFELSNAPLFALIPYLFWRRKYKINWPVIALAAVAVVVGFLPQILLSLSGGSNQLLDFSKWIVAQVLEKIQTRGSSLPNLGKSLEAFWHYGGRIFGTDWVAITLLGFIATATAVFTSLKHWRQKQLPALVELSLVSLALLCGAYLVAGPPSEAYFPPFFILLAILLGYWLYTLPAVMQKYAVTGVFVYLILNTYAIISANFFVMNGRSFQYDSVGEYRAIAKILAARSNQQPYQIMSPDQTELDIPAYFEHLKWIQIAEGYPLPGDVGKRLIIAKKDQPVTQKVLLIQELPTTTIYLDAVEYR